MDDVTARQETPTDEETLALVDKIADAFNRHDIDAIMSHFAEDAVFQLARGPEPCGTRLEGKDQIRKVLADRFAVITDMHWKSIARWARGNKAVSEWVVTGTTDGGEKLECLGCDLWEFRDGKIINKDTYWKGVG